jgi:hypothetical protein
VTSLLAPCSNTHAPTRLLLSAEGRAHVAPAVPMFTRAMSQSLPAADRNGSFETRLTEHCWYTGEKGIHAHVDDEIQVLGGR